VNLGKHAERPGLRGKKARIRHRLYKDAYACCRICNSPDPSTRCGLTCVHSGFAKIDEETEVEFQDWEGC
jgi:hypothetical protein